LTREKRGSGWEEGVEKPISKTAKNIGGAWEDCDLLPLNQGERWVKKKKKNGTLRTEISKRNGEMARWRRKVYMRGVG